MAVMVSVLVTALGAPGGAQIPTPLPTDLTGSPSPSPSPSPSGSPSPSPSPTGGGGSGGGSTPAPQPQPAPAPAPAGSSSGTFPGFPLVVPDFPRSPAQNTNRLLQILAPLSEQGVPLDQVVIQASAPFPVAGLASFSDDFGFPRYVPYPHLHEGTDIFADFGTPIVASGPGVLTGFGTNAVGGLSAWIAGVDGTGYYYTHMLGFADGLVAGQRVQGGTVIGFVGASGDAAGGAPHLHFEVHPPVLGPKGRILSGGATPSADGTAHTNTPAVDPKPFLDMWLKQAELNAQTLVAQLIQKFAGLSRELHFARRVDELVDPDAGTTPAEMIWFSIFEPSVGSIGLARQAATDMAVGIGGSIAERSAERARLASVHLAVISRYLRLSTMTGMPLYEESVQAAPGA